MFYRYKLDPDDNLNMEFADLLKKAIELLRAKKKLACLVHIEKKGQKIENLVEIYDNKTRINSTSNCLFLSLSIPTHQPPILPVIALFEASGTDYWPVDTIIDQLIEMMKALALSI